MTNKKSDKKSAKKNAAADAIIHEDEVTTIQSNDELEFKADDINGDDDVNDVSFDDDDDDDGVEAAPSSSSSDDVKKGPGRGKGPRRPRQIYYECGGIVMNDNGEASLAMAPITVVSPGRGEEFDRDGAKKEAIENFKVKFGVEPSNIDGPFYYVKGQLAPVRKRETLRTNTEEIRFTGERSTGIYKEWEVVANHLVDGKTAMVWFKSRVTPFVPDVVGQKPQPKPNAKRLPLDLIQNLKAID